MTADAGQLRVGVGQQLLALRGASARQRRAMISGWAGYWVDMVDVYLPIVALAPAIAYFQPEATPSSLSAALFIGTFAITMLGRPLGALVLGVWADRVGRRRLTLLSIAGFSACTGAIGLLPGYDTWGVAAPVTLLVLRFVNGIFLGGEYTAGTPLAFEHCPPRGRGLLGGLLLGAYSLAYVFISLVVLGVLLIAPAGGSSSAYVQWGWRIPFLLGAACGLILLLFRARVPESDVWAGAAKVQRPLRALTQRRMRGDVMQVLTVMTGLWLMTGSVVAVMPTLLLDQYEATASAVTWTLLASNLALFATFVVVGVISQVVGRRNVLVAGAAVACVAGLPLYAVVASGVIPTATALVLTVVTHVLVVGVWGAASSYCNERFPTPVRSTGFGVGYSLSLVLPSLSGVYMLGLAQLMPFRYTQLVLLVVGAGLLVAGALRGPETAEVDMTAADDRVHVKPPSVPAPRAAPAEAARAAEGVRRRPHP